MINRTSLIDGKYIYSHKIDVISEKEPVRQTEKEGMEYRSLLMIWCFEPFLKVYPGISRHH